MSSINYNAESYLNIVFFLAALDKFRIMLPGSLPADWFFKYAQDVYSTDNSIWPD